MRMAAVGDNCVDRYPEEGLAFPGGSCANAAVFARRLGVLSSYVGILGDDEAGELIHRCLAAEEVDLTRVRRGTEPSSTTDIRIDAEGNRVFTGHVPLSSKIQLTAEDVQYLQGVTWVHTGHSSATEHELPQLSGLAKVSFDFSYRDFTYAQDVLPFVTVAAFSREDFTQEQCEGLLNQAVEGGAETAVVTRGAEGVIALRDGELISFPARPVTAVDTVGAGDAFQTRFVLGLFRGESLSDAMANATSFAATVCTYRGAFGHATPWGRPTITPTHERWS